MKTLILASVTAAALMAGASFTPAAAQGGCGPGGHRGFDGYCHPNFRPYGGGYGYGWHRPYGAYGYGWHRPYGYGWHRGWGY